MDLKFIKIISMDFEMDLECLQKFIRNPCGYAIKIFTEFTKYISYNT